MADLTKLSFYSKASSFHVLEVASGSFNIPTATYAAGSNAAREYTINLDVTPDILQAQFNGPNSGPQGSIIRPASAWYVVGNSQVVQPGTTTTTGAINVYWYIYYEVSGKTVKLTMSTNQIYQDPLVTTSAITVQYKIVNYAQL